MVEEKTFKENINKVKKNYNLSYYAQSEKLGYSDITTQVPVVFILESLCKKLYNMEIGSK